MGGRGRAPKAADRLARYRPDKQPLPTRVIRFEPTSQPELPEGYDWPERTREWWAMWAASPLSETFGVTDWDFLLDTAVLHSHFWSGDVKVAAELRIRVAKFGATPEDRARLRIQFAQAENRDSRRERTGNKDRKSARERYGDVARANSCHTVFAVPSDGYMEQQCDMDRPPHY